MKRYNKCNDKYYLKRAICTRTFIVISFIILLGSRKIEVEAWTIGSLLPEIAPAKVDEVAEIVSTVLDGAVSEEQRKIQVQDLTANFDSSDYEANQFVYGELSVPTLATLFDAVGVHENERFLDIGSGDGALVFATALFYDEKISVSRGVEIVPDLKDRSEKYRSKFESIADRVEFHCADIYNCDERLRSFLADTSIAVCFATTWSRDHQGRILPELSSALGKHLKPGARVVMIDGKLNENDNLHWGGDLRIMCPDTAPYSVASLYEKT